MRGILIPGSSSLDLCEGLEGRYVVQGFLAIAPEMIYCAAGV